MVYAVIIHNLTCQLKRFNLFMLMLDLVSKGLKPVCSVHISVTAVLRFLTSIGKQMVCFPLQRQKPPSSLWRFNLKIPQVTPRISGSFSHTLSCTWNSFVCSLAVCSHGHCWAREGWWAGLLLSLQEGALGSSLLS